jgi:hypothetical protein
MARQAPALPVPLEVGEVVLVVLHVWVDGVEDDASLRPRQSVDFPQRSRRLPGAAREAEIAAEEENRVERAGELLDTCEWEVAGIHHAPPPAHLDRPGRDVDRERFQSAALGLEAVPARARTDIEHPAPHETERLALGPGPRVVLGKEQLGGQRRPGIPVVALELRLPGLAVEVVEQKPAEGVFARVENGAYAASDVRSPSSAAIGRIAATTFRMWSSSSTPSSSAPR